MRPRLRSVLAVSLGAVTLAVVAGCGGSSGEANGSTSSAPRTNLFDQSLHDRLPKSILDKGEIVFAGDAHPPYRVAGAGGKVTGFDPDLQALLGQVLGVKTRIETISGLPAALTGMQAGRYGAFNGPVKDTAEREAKFDNLVYMTSRTAYLFKAGSKVKDASGLCGAKVAYATGSIVEGQVKALSTWCTGQGAKPVVGLALADTNATILAVQSGRAEAAGATQSAVIDIVKQAGDKVYKYVLQTDEQGAGVDQLALLTPKSSGLGPVLLDAMKVLFDKDEYQKLMDRYGFTEVMVKAPALNVASAP
jgi:polar amino acid transport system substrate-binding protein